MSPFYRKTTVSFVLLGIILIVLTSFVALPLSENIEQDKRLLAKKESDYETSQEKVLILRKTAGDETKTNEIREKTLLLWPDDKAISNFIVDLEELAVSENLTFDNLSISENTPDPKNKSGSGYKTVQFSFDTKGSYDRVINIITKLEKFERFNSMKSLAIASKDSENVSAKFTGEIYYGK